MERYADDRFYNLVVKAEASRRIREVIVRSVPPGLRSELMEMAERKIDELLDDATIQKIVAHFASKSVTLEMLEDHVGRTLNAGWTKEDRSNLLGLWNGIKDGEFQVGEVFGKDNPNGDAQTNGAGAAAAVGAAMIKPREVPEAAKTGQADKTTSAPEPTKPIPESTTTDSRVDMVQEVAPITNPITNPDQPGRSADEARTNPVPVPNPPPIVPQPSTVPASAPEPEKRRPGRPRKQNPAEAAIGAGNAMPPTQPGTMFPREPGIEDETGDE
jgi:hypothetical protein